jgi:hypothetical protein
MQFWLYAMHPSAESQFNAMLRSPGSIGEYEAICETALARESGPSWG